MRGTWPLGKGAWLARAGLVRAGVAAACLGWGTVVAAQPSSFPVPSRAGAPVGLVTVRPEHANVGDPVIVTARVTARAGSTIEFPAAVAVGEALEALDPRVVRVRTSGGEVVAEATWRLVAWDTGAHPLPLGDALVTTNEASERVPLATLLLTVESVLPADTARRAPRAARDVIMLPQPWWDVILPWFVPFLVVALGAAIWRRNRRDRPPPPTARREAERAFARLAEAAWGPAGEPAREVAIATEIVRDFLAARYPGAPVALTTAELVERLPPGSATTRAALVELLVTSDLVKYARHGVNADEAAAFAARARSVLAQLAEADVNVSEAAA